MVIVYWIVYPACAGIDPDRLYHNRRDRSLPRMRGDRPSKRRSQKTFQPFTPHARGSTSDQDWLADRWGVYPACAGIDPNSCRRKARIICLPRMRGDRPHYEAYLREPGQFTPHARGSTLAALAVNQPGCVYPACAGIDLAPTGIWARGIGLPRMRGDRPIDQVEWIEEDGFTPHARGSTAREYAESGLSVVYPACAGIDLVHSSAALEYTGLPRMRGDRPRREAVPK